MNLNKDPESWQRVSVEAVMAGSRAQGENVLRMAIEDLLRLADAYEEAAPAHGSTRRARLFDRAWRYITEDGSMERVRVRLSIDDLRNLINRTLDAVSDDDAPDYPETRFLNPRYGEADETRIIPNGSDLRLRSRST